MKEYVYWLGSKELCRSTAPVEFTDYFPAVKKTELLIESTSEPKQSKSKKKRGGKKTTMVDTLEDLSEDEKHATMDKGTPPVESGVDSQRATSGEARNEDSKEE